MSATTDQAASPSTLNGHERCLLCGQMNPWSLGLRFRKEEDLSVVSSFRAHPRLQGYEGILHGGVVSAVLDSAMTNCLFHHGVQGVTGDLYIRFASPVPCMEELDLRAWLLESRPRIHRLRAEISLKGRVLAWAEARFLRRRNPASRPAKPDPRP